MRGCTFSIPNLVTVKPIFQHIITIFKIEIVSMKLKQNHRIILMLLLFIQTSIYLSRLLFALFEVPVICFAAVKKKICCEILFLEHFLSTLFLSNGSSLTNWLVNRLLTFYIWHFL